MILKRGHATKYLNDYHEGKIQQGLTIGCYLDNFIRFKTGQFVPVMGGDNTGKTYFCTWYFLCLTQRHGLKWCIWTDENSSGQVMRNLIQWLSGKPFLKLSKDEIKQHEEYLEDYFFFVDNKLLYKPEELLAIFKETNADGYLLDPFNQMEHTPTYTNNIDLIRKIKRWVKVNKKTVYLTMHPVTSTGRQGAIYPDKHEFAGFEMIPTKSMAEGGKVFANMCDDFIIIHRLTKHPEMKYTTFVSIDKVKDTDTGGQQTDLDGQVYLDFNNGLGFICSAVDPLIREFRGATKAMTPNTDFDKLF